MYLFMTFTSGLILARVLLARVDSDVTFISGESRLAKTSEVASSGFVFAHGSVRTGIAFAIRLFNFAVDARISFVTFAP